MRWDLPCPTQPAALALLFGTFILQDKKKKKKKCSSRQSSCAAFKCSQALKCVVAETPLYVKPAGNHVAVHTSRRPRSQQEQGRQRCPNAPNGQKAVITGFKSPSTLVPLTLTSQDFLFLGSDVLSRHSGCRV